jgi:hypothetical protein
MNPGLDLLDPLELALLMEAAEDLADRDRDDPARARWEQRMVARTMRSRKMPLPRRYINQILRADGRGGRKAASRTSQRAVARGVLRTLRGRRR